MFTWNSNRIHGGAKWSEGGPPPPKGSFLSKTIPYRSTPNETGPTPTAHKSHGWRPGDLFSRRPLHARPRITRINPPIFPSKPRGRTTWKRSPLSRPVEYSPYVYRFSNFISRKTIEILLFFLLFFFIFFLERDSPCPAPWDIEEKEDYFDGIGLIEGWWD